MVNHNSDWKCIEFDITGILGPVEIYSKTKHSIKKDAYKRGLMQYYILSVSSILDASFGKIAVVCFQNAYKYPIVPRSKWNSDLVA